MAVRKKTSRTPATRPRASKIDFMKATNNIGKPVAAVAGFAVGKFALKKLSKSQTVSGLMGTDMKDYIVPAAVTMGGLIGTQFTKNEYIRESNRRHERTHWRIKGSTMHERSQEVNQHVR